MTDQPQESVTRVQAGHIQRQWEATMGQSADTRLAAWQHVDELFSLHGYPAWLAVQHFVGCADGPMQGSENACSEQGAVLQARLCIMTRKFKLVLLFTSQ